MKRLEFFQYFPNGRLATTADLTPPRYDTDGHAIALTGYWCPACSWPYVPIDGARVCASCAPA